MGLWLRLVGIVLLVFGLIYVLSMVVGVLFWVGVAAAVIAVVVAVIGALGRRGENARPLSKGRQRKIERAADAALRELERRTGSRQ